MNEYEEIGETFVDNDEWENYSFPIKTNGGLKIVSVIFVNDAYDILKKEDRNLFIGSGSISYQ